MKASILQIMQKKKQIKNQKQCFGRSIRGRLMSDYEQAIIYIKPNLSKYNKFRIEAALMI